MNSTLKNILRVTLIEELRANFEKENACLGEPVSQWKPKTWEFISQKIEVSVPALHRIFERNGRKLEDIGKGNKSKILDFLSYSNTWDDLEVVLMSKGYKAFWEEKYQKLL